jgi:hypothetical protein
MQSLNWTSATLLTALADIMLNAVTVELPELYKFCHLRYNNSTALKFGNHYIRSEESAQQGDHLGPLLFLPYKPTAPALAV